MKYNIKDFFSKCDQFEVGWDVPSRANPGKYHTTLFWKLKNNDSDQFNQFRVKVMKSGLVFSRGWK